MEDHVSADPDKNVVKYRFSSKDEFVERHVAGTDAEYALEVWEIAKFNERKIRFYAWAVKQLRGGSTKGVRNWLFLVETKRTEVKFPDENEACQIRLSISGDRCWWKAVRVPMPYSLLGKGSKWDEFAAFKVVIPDDDRKLGLLRPTLPENPQPGDLEHHVLCRQNRLRFPVIFELRASDATRNMEISALRTMQEAREDSRRGKAFAYWLSLSEPSFSVNFFDHFPHLSTDAGLQSIPQPLRNRLVEKYRSFDRHQEKAFRELLKDIPCGMCIIPGGPGAGKTRWNLIVAAMAQAQDCVRPGETEPHAAKVLYMIDINKPLTDIASRMEELYTELGLDKVVIRMYSWNYPKKSYSKMAIESERSQLEFFLENRAFPSSDKSDEGGREKKSQKDERVTILDFSEGFIEAGLRQDSSTSYQQIRTRDACSAPDLDEAAWSHYQKHKREHYRHLDAMMVPALKKGFVNEYFKCLLTGLYRDTIAAADFIATTPVAAGKNLGGMFFPDLVFFDEAPHAREAATLSAIANFSPIAWIFTGDPRQIRPFVRTVQKTNLNPTSPSPMSPERVLGTHDTAQPPPNPWRNQLQVSMMERADKLGVVTHALLINHRARAGLHEFPSQVFYESRMITGLAGESLCPESTRDLKAWLYTELGLRCQIPRIRVNLDSSVDDVVLRGFSRYNKKHFEWVMHRVRKLLTMQNFLQPNGNSRGTILIMSPYKAAFFEYRNAIQDLKNELNINDDSIIEARTVDTAQGHEADVVFLDLVRLDISDHLGDGNRLNVALTRARQLEFVIADDALMGSDNYSGSWYLQQIFEGRMEIYNLPPAVRGDETSTTRSW